MPSNAASRRAITAPTAEPKPTSILSLVADDPLPIAPAPNTDRHPSNLLLIGTPETLSALEAQLDTLSPRPFVRTTIIVDGPRGAAAATLDSLPALAARFRHTLALISLPAALDSQHALARRALDAAGIPSRSIPPIADLLVPPAAPATPSTVPAAHAYSPTPAIDLASLIGRRPYDLDEHAVARILSGKRILITGAGGSIGSELARVAARFSPELIILMERAENALFEIDRQLARRFPAVPRRAVLHDIVDERETRALLADLQPHAVFHAAAHKHVPLMEDHPAHALTNNLFGTISITDAAIACGAERFVMISSDKAVNPTSVMGATKRLAEIYVSALSRRPGDTRLSMVRFGNVLGSACSVLEIWSAQLAEGGPLTVTDPRMTRYFMTIPEAATLVIQSATLDPRHQPPSRTPSTAAGSGGIFVLDMGNPIPILDLAVRFAHAHGLTPRIHHPGGITESPSAPHASHAAPTIDITFTGARPGEKLHEELAYAAEHLAPTAHPGIRAWRAPVGPQHAPLPDPDPLIADLDRARASRDPAAILAAIRRHVPEMRPAPLRRGV